MTQYCMHLDQIAITQTDTHVCEDCIKMGERWVHLRMCLVCGHKDQQSDDSNEKIRDGPEIRYLSKGDIDYGE